MAKKKFYAIAKLIIVRQIDIDADDELSIGEFDALVEQEFQKQYGDFDEFEVVEADYR